MHMILAALSSILFQLTTSSNLSEQYVKLFLIQYLSLCYVKPFSSYQSTNISTPPKLLGASHLTQDQKVHFQIKIQSLNQDSRRNLKVKKYSEGICCTLCHESSFLRALILKEAPPRQKSQSMGSHAVPTAEGEIQSRHGRVKPGHCLCSDSISLLSTWQSSKYFNEIYFRAASRLLSLPQNLSVRLYCTLQNRKDLKHPSL